MGLLDFFILSEGNKQKLPLNLCLFSFSLIFFLNLNNFSSSISIFLEFSIEKLVLMGLCKIVIGTLLILLYYYL